MTNVCAIGKGKARPQLDYIIYVSASYRLYYFLFRKKNRDREMPDAYLIQKFSI